MADLGQALLSGQASPVENVEASVITHGILIQNGLIHWTQGKTYSNGTLVL